MKIIGVTVLVAVMLFGLMLLLDIIQGYDVKLSINHIMNPFSTMRPAEIFIFAGSSILLIIYYWRVLSKEKKKKEIRLKSKTFFQKRGIDILSRFVLSMWEQMGEINNGLVEILFEGINPLTETEEELVWKRFK